MIKPAVKVILKALRDESQKVIYHRAGLYLLEIPNGDLYTRVRIGTCLFTGKFVVELHTYNVTEGLSFLEKFLLSLSLKRNLKRCEKRFKIEGLAKIKAILGE